MDFFDKFDSVLKNNFHGDFQAMVNSPYRFDRFTGMDIPVRVKEIDRRDRKENGYIRTPDVQPVEPTVETPVEADYDFKVIDLDAEMDRRRKNTEASNPVQPESVETIPLKLTPGKVTKPSPRGLASPPKTGKTTKGGKVTATGGNRQQRRAAEATIRKGGNKADKNPRKNDNRDNSGTQETSSPEKVNLADLGFGFRLE